MKDNIKNKAKKIITRLLGGLIVLGFLVLFAAAIRIKDKQKCKSMRIEVITGEKNFFVRESDIRHLILEDRRLNPVGQLLGQINTRLLERTVKTNPWVKDAQLYLDNNNELNIRVIPRQPLARVFTVSGASFYIDTAGVRVPVTGNFSARVPVFTGFGTDGAGLGRKDSAVYAQIISIGRFIDENAFWMAQVEQINITPGGEFELVPKVGNQVILMGDGNNVEEKFGNLFAFYKDALSKTGWETYDTINIAFSGQVVCTRKGNRQTVKINSSANTTKNNNKP